LQHHGRGKGKRGKGGRVREREKKKKGGGGKREDRNSHYSASKMGIIGFMRRFSQ